MANLTLELRYALRDRTIQVALLFVLAISGYATLSGYLEVQEQIAEISLLIEETASDQTYTLGQQADAGSAAYYVQHVTYQPPSPLAFAAIGTREDLPWLHRLKMLALEGQIYEADTGNAELSRLGRLDFAFLVAVIAPLILILLLYDLDARERRDGRYELLSATSTSGTNPLFTRAVARTLLLFTAVVAPFLFMALLVGTPLIPSLGVILVTALHLAFWLLVARFIAARCTEAPTAATALLACWLLFTVAIPATSRIWVESSAPVPAGGELLLTQREAVNDAWDLPKSDTMTPFTTSHPEWAAYSEVSQPFEWKWYYAFQQVGDEVVAAQSNALADGIARRDRLMGFVALFSPPLAAERWLTHFAATDRRHHRRYLNCIRDFHAKLREFHYPMLFEKEDYSLDAMQNLPRYQPCES